MAFYTDFSADPNSVPKLNGLPGIIDNIQKGYMLAQLPEQVRNQRAQMRLATEKAQMENQYYPQMQEAQIGEYNARSNLANTQSQAAQFEMMRRKALYDALQGNSEPQPNMGSPAPSPQQQPPQQDYGQFNLLNGLIDNTQRPSINAAPSQGTPQYGNNSPYYNNQQSGDGSSSIVVNAGNPAKYRIDDIVDKNPGLNKELEDMGFKKTVDTKLDDDGRMISTTTYPSGRQVATITRIGPTAAQKKLSEEMATKDAEAYDSYTNALDSSVSIDQSLSNMRNLLDDPDFKNSVGPLNRSFSRVGWADPRVQELTTQINGFSREIQFAKAAALKVGNNAAATKLGIVEDAKPSVTDTYYGMVGKMEALNTINKWNMEYSDFMANAITEGKMSRNKAILAARKAIPADKYSGEIDRQIKQGKLAGELHEKGLSVDRGPNGVFMVKIPTPEGDKRIPVDQYENWLRDFQKENGGRR